MPTAGEIQAAQSSPLDFTDHGGSWEAAMHFQKPANDRDSAAGPQIAGSVRGQARLPRYQCYFLTPDRHIARQRDIEATDDLEALKISCRMLAAGRRYRAFELWQEDRRVGSEFDVPAPPSKA